MSRPSSALPRARNAPPGGAALRRRITAALLAAALLAGCHRAQPLHPALAQRVVLVSIDTLRADYLGCYGATAAATPHLDALAEEGVRFAAAFSPAPLTLPSHASLLTGLDPPHHGVRDNSTFRLPDDVPVLAQALAERGFATAAFVGSIMLDRQYGLARGFDVYDDAMGRRPARAVYGISERPAGQVVDAALAWLAGAPERFFLWVHVFDVHAPWQPPGIAPDASPEAHYAGEVELVDAQLGRLFEAVDRRFDAEHTLFVVTADHGESLGEHGEATHSLSLYDATQHVPLLLRGLGLPAGTVVRDLVRLVDVAPTVLRLTGLEAWPQSDGLDLVPLVAGEDEPPRLAYLETLAPQLGYGWSPLLGLRSSRYKYVRAPRPELYDLWVDPRELDNRWSEAGPAAGLDAQLDSRALPGKVSRLDLAPSDEQTRLLAEIGYVAGRGPRDAAALGRVGGIDPKDKIAVPEKLAQAARARIEGRPAEALALLDELGDEGPTVAVAAAGTALDLGDPRRAAGFASRAIEQAPLDYDAHRMLGYALMDLGQLDRSELSLTTAARINPAAAAAWLGLGILAERRGQLDAASAHYARAAEARGGSSEAVWRLAALHIQQGRPAEADALLAELPEDELDSPAPALRLARAERKAGRRDAALRRLERASGAHPESVRLRRALRRQRRLEAGAEPAAQQAAAP